MKFSLIQSTVDWMDGSKSLATRSLYAGRDVSDNGRRGGRITLLASAFPP